MLRPLSLVLTTLVSALLVSAQQPSTTPGEQPVVPYGWEPAPASCIAEPPNGVRALGGANFAADDMTIAKCIAFCDARDYVLAGIEYSRECFCGPFLNQQASLEQQTGCTMPCAGLPDTICGGPDRLSLYVSTSPRAQRLNPDFKSANTIVPAGWTDLGCYDDNADARILGAESTTGGMNVDKCTGFCSLFGFPYAGLTDGNACFCDTELRFAYDTSDQCNSICSGDNMVYCGGTISTRIYNNPSLSPFDPGANSYIYRGCLQDPPAYALTGAAFEADTMSVEICTAFCAQGMFKYASLGFGRECRCGNEFSNGAGIDKPSQQCTIPCAGDASANCGGRYAIALYEMNYDTQPAAPADRRALQKKRRARITATRVYLS